MSSFYYAAFNPKHNLKKYYRELEPIESDEIEARVTHCGLCHSDLHLIDNAWGNSIYPLVPGHEIVAVVTRIGSKVTHIKKNQRIGIGWQSNACHHCIWCQSNQEHLCKEAKYTCLERGGGFSEYIRINENFAIPLPEALSSFKVAPLLCAGITVYSPLRQSFFEKKKQMAIVGLGGLGHLAVQFAKAMGYEVTVFTSTLEKKEDALALGAEEVFITTSIENLKKQKDRFDLILITVASPLDWKLYLDMVSPNGKLCFLSAIPELYSIPILSLIKQRKMICGSNRGSLKEMQDMLKFAVDQKISAWVETLSMNEVNHAIRQMRKNKVRYRMVLENQT